MPPDFVSYSGLIIDDIVLPDGKTYFNTLGGGATHALAGMRVWSDSLGYFAAVGSDFSPAHRRQLEAMNVNLDGLVVREGQPTARAWQLFEPDERRIEVFRTDIDDFYNLEVRFPEMSDAYRRARGYHIGHGTLADMVELMANLRAVNQNAVVVWEPTPLQHVNDAVSFRAIFAQVDAFSPDVSESLAITGQSETEAAIHTLLDWGAKIVALRMGARGSRLYTPEGETISIPAAPASVVDTTGGGNAYLGGLLVALADGDSVADAGAKAAVSASFAIEQFGVPTFDERLFAEAETRLAWVKAHRAVIA